VSCELNYPTTCRRKCAIFRAIWPQDKSPDGDNPRHLPVLGAKINIFIGTRRRDWKYQTGWRRGGDSNRRARLYCTSASASCRLPILVHHRTNRSRLYERPRIMATIETVARSELVRPPRSSNKCDSSCSISIMRCSTLKIPANSVPQAH